MRRKLEFDQGLWCRPVLANLYMYADFIDLTVYILFGPHEGPPMSSAASSMLKDKNESPAVNENSAIDISKVNLSMKDLMEMGANFEETDEVVDLYHERIPYFLRPPQATAPASVSESTPVKSGAVIDVDASPRRSPRGHCADGSLFIIIKFCINDLVGVDPRLDIPKILIMAHGDNQKAQSVNDVKWILEDKTEKRLLLQFDFCM